MRIANEVTWTVDFGSWQGVTAQFAPWMTASGNGGIAGAQCGTTDGYSHPDYPVNEPAGATPTETPSGTPIDPRVAGQTYNGKCQATTGT